MVAERFKAHHWLGDYSYVMEDCDIWYAQIGKFCNIAAALRINAANHPMWRTTLHHFIYRASSYWEDANMDKAFFSRCRENAIIIGHGIWLGNSSIILPGVTIGKGAVISAKGLW